MRKRTRGGFRRGYRLGRTKHFDKLVKLVAEGRAQVRDHAGRIAVRAADRFRHDAIDKF
jgi:hypothetical protein